MAGVSSTRRCDVAQRIRITPEQVRQAGNQFRQGSEETQNTLSKLRSTVNTLQSEWEGMTKERFYGEYTKWESSMSNFVELLQSIGQQLDTIATRFEQADQAK